MVSGLHLAFIGIGVVVFDGGFGGWMDGSGRGIRVLGWD